MKTKKQFPKWLGNTLILILLGLVVAGAWYKGTHRTDTWNKVHQQKTVTIGIDDTFVPMGFRDKKGKLIGYDVEMAKAAFEKMGLKPKFQVIDWSMKETELNTGHIDAIWNGYTMTPERAKHAAFTKPYHEDNQVLLTKANSGINTPQDMHGKQLGVQSGSVGFDDFNQNPKVLKQYLGTKPVQYDTFDKAINDVKVGRINAVLIDGDYAKYYLAHNHSNEPMKLVKTNFPPDYDAVGLRKQDKTLRKKLNKAIGNLHRDGTEARLSKKYFGDPDAVK
ncbi:amino acid ABC transporter substrate-binding protein [Lactobacillus sanfranciscensis]|uniref:amino acid ABC transporter substrate-binding protein n=1 Tax=Fructilactobacillus sanfranciscensis TaxID=1625 RepID=UPI00031B640F|nr:amino acid ABC transporter substrate-binding protein [Fructilactobacillus sanfranciscensis]NDR76277.1 amino acid ABC transporter substrate-binding protein [Fructilactobacillus sanfranciscensis]NDR96957.1 amino acid ABC transporter substrate-binding protein [Fructilactobacillus sanfranciscensis]NDS04784.1 amino acid ABC transporter substrate-binding protein [Fructilactobacillus sanfranciscensis]POH18481.1 amino acid ABC transporter substrate-binding protein [Fructilactobacillus sanfranciscens